MVGLHNSSTLDFRDEQIAVLKTKLVTEQKKNADLQAEKADQARDHGKRLRAAEMEANSLRMQWQTATTEVTRLLQVKEEAKELEEERVRCPVLLLASVCRLYL